ncbi:MAG: thrombospondin type 3 repeat-containing protein [Saprospiraceae bacterium]|nr:thrombospondin type 3 repeat-containing protein [Saprospiraceae bacterium]
MKRMSYTLWTLTFLLPMTLMAQHKWEATIFIGGANYQGDLVPTMHPYPEETNLALGLSGRYFFSNQWALRLGATYGQISGTDQHFTDTDFTVRRQFSFRSNIIESAALLEWEPFGNRRYPGFNQFKALISPYFFAGGGLAISNPETVFALYQNGEAPPKVMQDKAIKYPTKHFAVPMGMGIKFDLGRRVALGLEGGTRYAFSDYLDGVSKSANPDKGDWYAFAGATLTFRFFAKDEDKDGIPDKEDRCPKVFGHITAKGCPDRDGDGVEDVEDLCPDEAGVKILGGCPDADEDGIPNHEDLCPYAAGPDYTQGCPDTDGDKIADKDDWCAKLAGLSYKGGCPLLDTDGDGVVDEKTFCKESIEQKMLATAWPKIELPFAFLSLPQRILLSTHTITCKRNLYE